MANFKHIGDNKVLYEQDGQKVINKFNAEIRAMNSTHYKKKVADAAKAKEKNKK